MMAQPAWGCCAVSHCGGDATIHYEPRSASVLIPFPGHHHHCHRRHTSPLCVSLCTQPMLATRWCVLLVSGLVRGWWVCHHSSVWRHCTSVAPTTSVHMGSTDLPDLALLDQVVRHAVLAPAQRSARRAQSMQHAGGCSPGAHTPGDDMLASGKGALDTAPGPEAPSTTPRRHCAPADQGPHQQPTHPKGNLTGNHSHLGKGSASSPCPLCSSNAHTKEPT